MKKNYIKIIIVFVIILLLASLIVFNNNNKIKNNTKKKDFKVAGITRSPLYLPIFVGMEKNMFDGLKVKYVNTTGGDVVNTMLLSGEIDAALNSLNISITNVNEKNNPISIAKLTSRGGITLISKVPLNEIKTIVSAKKGGLPNEILEKSTDYEIVANLSPQEGVTYFLNQDVDAIMAFEPFATQLKNKGYKSKSMNSYYEELPFNTVLVMEENLNDDKYKRFVEGLKKATDYIYSTDSSKVAEEVKEVMEFNDTKTLSSIIDTFKEDNVWNKSLKLDEKEYEYYLEFTGLQKVDYKKIYKNILDK